MEEEFSIPATVNSLGLTPGSDQVFLRYLKVHFPGTAETGWHSSFRLPVGGRLQVRQQAQKLLRPAANPQR
jgi:hypothetical protein